MGFCSFLGDLSSKFLVRRMPVEMHVKDLQLADVNMPSTMPARRLVVLKRLQRMTEMKLKKRERLACPSLAPHERCSDDPIRTNHDKQRNTEVVCYSTQQSSPPSTNNSVVVD